MTASSCGNHKLNTKNATIALQALNGYDSSDMAFLQKDVAAFFQIPVVIRNDKTIPASFVNFEKGKRYHADQIIKWLDEGEGDSIIVVAGLTHEDIYTSKRDRSGKIKAPEQTYAVWGIFGLGYCPGGSCVISDRRLVTSDKQKFRRRLRTVVIHEIGHNLELPHCPQKHCIMNDANETIRTVDQSGRDYCEHCNRKINRTSRP